MPGEEVTVPAAGKLPKRTVLIVVGAAAAFIVWRYAQQRKSATAAPDPNSINPDTGLPYAADSGTGTESSYSNPVPNADGSAEVNTVGTLNTNEAWYQQVLQDLGGIGYDTGYAASVLGAYLAGQPITSLSDQALIRVAWAYRGKPPSGPTSINTGSTGTPTPAPTPAKITRKGSATTAKPIHTSWLAELRGHYTGFTSANEGTYAYMLAHANGVSGAGNPMKTVKIIILPATL